jgi:hypothetical protein
MSVNVNDAPDAERYPWPAAQGDLDAACGRIARHLARGGARVIGLLPVGGELDSPPALSPLLDRVATALVGFVRKDVALVDTWRTWGDPKAERDVTVPRIREIRPQVLAITPPPCEDVAAATVALQQTLAALAAWPEGVDRVLVHLGGYAAPGTAPKVMVLVDGVVVVVAARRTRRSSLKDMISYLPEAKRLGAILVG